MVFYLWNSLNTYRYCLTYLIISWCHPQYFVPLQPGPGFVCPWGPLYITFHMWVGCYIYSGTHHLLVLLYIPCIEPTFHLWPPHGPHILGTSMGSRGWIYDSKFLSKYLRQWIFCQSIMKYGGLPWVNPDWNETSSWYPVWSWCQISQRAFLGTLFLQIQILFSVCPPGFPETPCTT